MTLVYASKLGIKIRHINIKAWKIDSSTFETFGMVLTSFQGENKLRKARFFSETFLLADLSISDIRNAFLNLQQYRYLIC